tara:strand:- start:281 stop:637 length:357 start_codon:yes stop_codon:yes gene_type:complete
MKKIIILVMFFAQFSFAEQYDTSCSLDSYWDDAVIVPSSINANITDREFPNEEGKIGITAKVAGNGKMQTYSGNFSYTKVGSRLELEASSRDSIPTKVTVEEFKNYFGSFPKITCVAR